jgi:hypothetical protein
MKTSEAQKRASMKYAKANLRRVIVNLNKDTHKDLIDRVEYLKTSQMSIQDEIITAWREYLKKK